MVRGSAPARLSERFPPGAAKTRPHSRASRFGPCTREVLSVCVCGGGRGAWGARRVTAIRVSHPFPARGDPQAGAGTRGGRVEVNLQPPWSCEAYQKCVQWEAVKRWLGRGAPRAWLGGSPRELGGHPVEVGRNLVTPLSVSWSEVIKLG